MVILQCRTALCKFLDGRAFKRSQDFGLVAEEFCAVINNLRSNDLEVSYLPHSQAHKNPSQTRAETVSLLAFELLWGAKCSQNSIVCRSRSQPNTKRDTPT